ncbi:fluoride efflux transporter CrcB [Erythrobacter sp. YT30]|uniref:fluoride efflux transporter CrcB n=1 Tax=Erythrobacter sp. YT30 TaxID=1735012 RepID=UPI00076BC878|nr:fluoride efflux transporter CrcB [Erythrobacter sp. YT30]KWV90348.1 camphor resistance protein CrcB [Erythrobacter sp. YT30]
MSAASLSPILASIYVGVGGAVGAVGRYLLGSLLLKFGSATTGFPWAILTINLLGSLMMGLLFGWLAQPGEEGENLRLLLGVGMLGGFTTFSAFSLEIILLIQRGAFGLAAIYVGASVLGGVAALLLGLIIMGELG